MNAFKTISVIVQGFYVKVTRVKNKKANQIFAMKSIRKFGLIKSGKSETVTVELNVMMKQNIHLL
jgi:hypothetical protein